MHHDLIHLDAPFSMEERRAAVFASSAEKAPGPGGYIGRFFRSFWDVLVKIGRASCRERVYVLV